MPRIIYSLFLLLACTLFGCVSDKEPEGANLQVGDEMPVFSVTLNNGEEISSISLKGKVSVIVFFNTGCRDCQQELPVIQELWKLYKDNEEVVIVPIAREEKENKINEYWQQNGLTMPFSPQPDRRIYNLFATSQIPRIYIVGPHGLITASFDDSDMPSLDTLEAQIKLYIFSTPTSKL